MKRKINIVGLLALLTFFFAISTVDASATELRCIFTAPVIEKGIDGYDVISMGLSKAGNAGLPVLPFKTVRVLIPYGEELESIEVISGNKTFIGEGFFIEPGQAQIPSCFNGTISRTPPNASLYNSTEEFPSGLYSALPVQDMCGYKILFLNLYPVRYVPKPGEVWYYENMTVVVSTKAKKQPSGTMDFYRALPEDRARVLDLVDNPEVINTYDIQKVKLGGRATSIVDPADSYDYVIITNDELKSSNGDYTFQDLINWKNQKGVKATIVTREQIENEPAYYWDGQYGDGYDIPEFNETYAQIRNFIKDAYQNWGIKYVLLGGDYDPANPNEQIIPYRGFYGFVDNPPPEEDYDDDNITADLYFAALNGSWNSDLDDWWGEPGEADLCAEVFVGRAPVDSESEVSNFVDKTITYERTAADYLKDVELVGSWLGRGGIANYGGNFKDEIKDGSCNHGYCTVGFPPYFDVETLYDRDWPGFNPGNPYTTGWSNTTIMDKINDGLHIINSVGHGNAWYEMKMWSENDFNTYNDVDDLTNTESFFGYAGGCDAGAFDNKNWEDENFYPTDCILEQILVTSEHGAFAYVGSSRFTWDRDLILPMVHRNDSTESSGTLFSVREYCT